MVQALGGAIADKIITLEAADAAAVGGDPEMPGVILGDIPDEGGTQPGGRALVVDPEAHPVEPRQSLLGADPDVAAGILKDLLDRIHRQAIFGRVVPDVVLGDELARIEGQC